MKVTELFEAIKLGPQSEKAKAFIKRVYDKYPVWPLDNRQRCIVWGEGDDQEFVNFELETSNSVKDAVEVKWFSSYPHRKGVGMKASKLFKTKRVRME